MMPDILTNSLEHGAEVCDGSGCESGVDSSARFSTSIRCSGACKPTLRADQRVGDFSFNWISSRSSQSMIQPVENFANYRSPSFGDENRVPDRKNDVPLVCRERSEKIEERLLG